MIMRFRIGNTTNNNFYNNLRNFDNLLVEYQRGLIEIQKKHFLKILKYRVRNVMKNINISIFFGFLLLYQVQKHFSDFLKNEICLDRSHENKLFSRKSELLYFFTLFLNDIVKTRGCRIFKILKKTIFLFFFAIIQGNCKNFEMS